MKRLLINIIRWFFGISGFITFLLVAFSFTDLPYLAYHRLGTSGTAMDGDPDIIVLLGGSGMPSPDGLMRCYFAAQTALDHPLAMIIIAHSSSRDDSLVQLELMAHEMIIRGIEPSRIRYEPLGFNTRSQAVNIAGRFQHGRDTLALLVVTSPEHMYRSVKTFRKAGFFNVGGYSAFEQPIDEQSASDNMESGDLRVKSLSLRYNMWNYLRYELIVLREYAAIFYYRMKGWI